MGMYGELGEKTWAIAKPILILLFFVVLVSFALYGSWYLFLEVIEAIARTIKNA